MAELLTINASESAAHSFYAERGSRQDFCLSHSDNGVDNGPLCHAVEAIKPSQIVFFPRALTDLLPDGKVRVKAALLLSGDLSGHCGGDECRDSKHGGLPFDFSITRTGCASGQGIRASFHADISGAGE